MSNAVELFILIGHISHVDLLYTFVSNKLDQLHKNQSDRTRTVRPYAYFEKVRIRSRPYAYGPNTHMVWNMSINIAE